MITITQDAELMTNILTANPVPVANAFAAFTDVQNNPGVVSHSQDNKLEAIVHVNGKPQMFDLNEIWKIKGDIQAFGLWQDANHHLWIAIAAEAKEAESRFYLIYDVDPNTLLSFSTGHIIEATGNYAKIHAVYMVSKTFLFIFQFYVRLKSEIYLEEINQNRASLLVQSRIKSSH